MRSLDRRGANAASISANSRGRHWTSSLRRCANSPVRIRDGRSGAVSSAHSRCRRRSATHKAIIVLTDGIDTSSATTAREGFGLASSIDVPVFVVATVPALDQRLMLQAFERATPADAADLRDLTEWTGGQVVFASTFSETVVAAANLVGELRQQYVLAIEAANGREWRRLDVRVRRPSTTVKARSGYYAG